MLVFGAKNHFFVRLLPVLEALKNVFSFFFRLLSLLEKVRREKKHFLFIFFVFLCVLSPKRTVRSAEAAQQSVERPVVWFGEWSGSGGTTKQRGTFLCWRER